MYWGRLSMGSWRARLRIPLLLSVVIGLIQFPSCARKSDGHKLQTVREMTSLSAEELAEGRPVELHGTVTLLDPAWRLLVVQDDTGGVLVELPATPPNLQRGDLIEVKGATSSDGQVPSVTNTFLRVVGTGKLPQPLVVRLQDVPSSKALYRLVETEFVPSQGSLGDGSHTAHFTLEVSGKHLDVVGRMFRSYRPSSLVGRKLRVRGVPMVFYSPTGTVDHLQLLFEDESDVDVLEKPQELSTDTRQLPLLTSIRQLKSLTAKEAELGYPMAIEGTVTLVNARHIGVFIQKDSLAAYVFLSPEIRQSFQPGQHVQIKGRSGIGGFAPVVVADRVEVLGRDPMPKPLVVRADDPFENRNENVWAQLNGIATAVIPDGNTFTLQLFSGTKRIVIRFSQRVSAEELAPLIDAEVSVQGIYAANYTASKAYTGTLIYATSPDMVKVVSPPPTHSESRTIGSLSRFDFRGRPRHRVTLSGSVSYRDRKGRTYLQDNDGAVRIVSNDVEDIPLNSTAVVEGFLSPDSAQPQLEEARWLSISPGSPPSATHVLAESTFSGELDGKLVSIDGSLDDTRLNGGELELNLHAGRTRFNAFLVSPNPTSKASRLRPGVLLHLTGICETANDPRTVGRGLTTLWLRNPDDIVILRPAPWWDLKRALYAASVAFGLLVLALAWVVHLQRKLVHQIDLQQMFIEYAPAGLAMLNRDMRYVQASVRWCKDRRVKREEILGKSHYDVFPNLPPHFREIHRRGLAGESVKRDEDYVTAPDGSQHWIRWEVRPWGDLKSERGGGIIIFSEDITERREADAAARRYQSELRSFIENAPYGICRAGVRDNRFLNVNPAFVDMLGYTSEEEVKALRLSTNFYYDVHERDIFLAQIKGRDSFKGVEVRCRRKDGKPITLRVSGRRMHDEIYNKDVIEAIVEDVTEHRKLQEQFFQSQKMEAVGRLAGGIAHDFNNLLGVILGYSELASAEIQPELRRRIQAIKKASEQAASLTAQLLAFSRKQVLQPKALDLNAVVKDTLSILSRLIGEDIEIEMRLSEHPWLVKADPGQISQVIMNMAVNARDAMPKGGRFTIETANIEFSDDNAPPIARMPAGRYVALAVSDTGVGMDAETQAHIFDPFFTTKPEGKGTGLGLATVYGIVNQSDGFISVKSALNQGSTFTVYLPQYVSAIQSSIEQPLRASVETVSATVLVVEDTASLRELLYEGLQMKGYTVVTAANGTEAVDLAEQHSGPIDLLITDIVMPNMSGAELAQKVAAVRPDIRILFMSGYADDTLAEQGAFDPQTFLQKPFTLAMLTEKIQETLSKK